MNSCIIVCNGYVENYEEFKNMFDDSFIICADGGSRHLIQIGIIPNIIIGDFDSSVPKDIEYFKQQGAEIKTYPVDKDFTDTELALSEAINMGFEKIKILSGTGHRLDHTLANILLLSKAIDNKVECCIQNEKNRIIMLKGHYNHNDLIDENESTYVRKHINLEPVKYSSITIDNEESFKVSLIPISETCEGVCITGVEYPLDNATIKIGQTIGISNEFIDLRAHISIEKGLLLVILSKD